MTLPPDGREFVNSIIQGIALVGGFTDKTLNMEIGALKEIDDKVWEIVTNERTLSDDD
jgi:hypothetical protein